MDVRLDFPFTERDDPRLRARIARDLETIARRALQHDSHARAIVLTGGFSRGEGTARDGVPVNDYDLVVVRDRPGAGPLPSLAEGLSREVGIEVDLHPVWRRRLPFVGRKLFWLDVRLGGRVIAGEQDALQGLRRLAARDLAEGERARLLANRAVGLLLALPEGDKPVDEALRDLQSVKALLAAMDARLLHRGLYAARLRDRLAMTSTEPDHAAFASAVAWKLTGEAPLPDDVWDVARDALLRAVHDTHARASADGAAEHAFHLLAARRIAWQPSQRIRHEAWANLAATHWPRAPQGFDASAFLKRRARTLH